MEEEITKKEDELCGSPSLSNPQQAWLGAVSLQGEEAGQLPGPESPLLSPPPPPPVLQEDPEGPIPAGGEGPAGRP